MYLRRQFMHKMWQIHLTLLLFFVFIMLCFFLDCIQYVIFDTIGPNDLSSLFQRIISIIPRYIWSIIRSVPVSALHKPFLLKINYDASEKILLLVECRICLHNPGFDFISCITATVTLFNILFPVKIYTEKFYNGIFIPFKSCFFLKLTDNFGEYNS
jgi:hypothetical protein